MWVAPSKLTAFSWLTSRRFVSRVRSNFYLEQVVFRGGGSGHALQGHLVRGNRV